MITATINLGDVKGNKNKDVEDDIFPSWEEPETKNINSKNNIEDTNQEIDDQEDSPPPKKRRKAYTKEVIIPKGLIIPISFKQEVKSKNYDAGDMAAIKVVDNVYVDGELIFKKGNTGFARIVKSKNQRFFARTGIIEINDGEINDKFGNPHNIEIKIKKTGKPVTDSGTVVTIKKKDWPFTFFNVNKGKDVRISSGAIYHAIIITEDSVIQVKSYK